MWPTSFTVRESGSSCVLQLRAVCVAPGRPDGSISNSRISGINALIVFAPYTLDMLSFVVAFAFVENAIVFFLLGVSHIFEMNAPPHSPFRHKVAHGELDTHADTSVRIEQLQHLIVLSFDVLLQLFSAHREIVKERLDNDSSSLLGRHY
jgi:hypothetical protein